MITREAPEQRVLLRNVGWETYERLREEREERPTPRFFGIAPVSRTVPY